MIRTVYVCESKVCSIRDLCAIHRQRDAAPTEIHITHFIPPEEHSESCPHFTMIEKESDE